MADTSSKPLYKWQAEGRVPTVGENEQEMADLRKQMLIERAARAALAKTGDA